MAYCCRQDDCDARLPINTANSKPSGIRSCLRRGVFTHNNVIIPLNCFLFRLLRKYIVAGKAQNSVIGAVSEDLISILYDVIIRSALLLYPNNVQQINNKMTVWGGIIYKVPQSTKATTWELQGDLLTSVCSYSPQINNKDHPKSTPPALP